MFCMLRLSAGFDYEKFNETFPIHGGEEKCFDLTIYDDELPESDEDIILQLNSSNNALGNLITSHLTVVDDDGTYMYMYIHNNYDKYTGIPHTAVKLAICYFILHFGY